MAEKPETQTEQSWERELIARIALEALAEQRRARRWGIFFKLLLALYLLAFLFLYLPPDWQQGALTGKPITALVDIDGVIAADRIANADNIVSGLRAAFKNKNTRGVILRINSPGGSPVQADYVYREIRRLRAEYPDIPLYAVITDICASGGYYIAAAADKIYASQASMVGSIGVVFASFGFVEALDKLGIERRLLTAGQSKGLFDPFSPLKPEEVAHIENMLRDIHQQFIDVVKTGRGERLKEDPEIFSGLVWTGEQSLELGLVDALGSAGHVAREVIGAEDIVDFTVRENYLDRFARKLGSALAQQLNSQLKLQ